MLLARLSLTQRLTLFFGGLVAFVALGLSLLFLVVTEHHFALLDHVTLQGKQQLIENVLRDANSPDDARWRLGEALSYHEGLFVQVRGGPDAVVFASPGIEAAMHVQVVPNPGGAESNFGVYRRADVLFRTLTFKTQAAYSPAPLDVWLALDTHHHARFMSALRRDLVVYALVALLLCALLAWLAARQGLAPLRDMKARAARVTGQQLGERMAVGAMPVEMADLARALNGMLDRLQDDFQQLTDFSSDLAHELRTPISNLLTQTQVALAHPRDAATYRDILASNIEELERLARMVTDMLLLAKTEHGVDLPRRECFNAHTEVQALADFYEAVAEEKRIHLAIDGEATIDGDRNMFRRALGNLLSNALRHTPEGGDVMIRIAASAEATTVAVQNTGADIDARALSRLFDRFYRVDPARAHPGADRTGLGLAITRAIAQAHGGSVGVRSSDGRTRFTLTFPRGR